METKTALTALTGLAHATRLAIFRLLVPAGAPGLAAGQLGEALRLPPATLSFHLKELRHAGLLTQRRAGRTLYYAADYTAMNALLAYLTENCCQADAGGCEAVCAPPPVPARKRRSSSATRRPL